MIVTPQSRHNRLDDEPRGKGDDEPEDRVEEDGVGFGNFARVSNS